jgi:hypothetical protein
VGGSISGWGNWEQMGREGGGGGGERRGKGEEMGAADFVGLLSIPPALSLSSSHTAILPRER